MLSLRVSITPRPSLTLHINHSTMVGNEFLWHIPHSLITYGRVPNMAGRKLFLLTHFSVANRATYKQITSYVEGAGRCQQIKHKTEQLKALIHRIFLVGLRERKFFRFTLQN